MLCHEKGVLDGSTMYFHTASNLAKSIFFYPLLAGHYSCDKNYFIKRNNFNSYLLIYVKYGSGIIIIDDFTYYSKPNDVVLLNCHNPHTYYTPDSWEIDWIHFDGNTSQELHNLIVSHSGCVIPMGKSLIIPRYLNMILENFRSPRQISEPIISCYIQRMLTEILLISTNSTKYDNENKVNLMLDAVTYIENNYMHQLSVKNISSYVNFSPYHFSRLFKKETGYSPYEFIIKTRIDKSKILLKETDLSIKEIAFNTGFASESSFVTSFYLNVKMTPSVFRNTAI